MRTCREEPGPHPMPMAQQITQAQGAQRPAQPPSSAPAALDHSDAAIAMQSLTCAKGRSLARPADPGGRRSPGAAARWLAARARGAPDGAGPRGIARSQQRGGGGAARRPRKAGLL